MHAVLVAVLSFAALKSIYFEGDGALREAIARELGEQVLVAAREDAALWVLARTEDRLVVEVIAPPATVLVTRAFALDRGPVPAIRAAVLLIADAAHGEHDALPPAVSAETVSAATASTATVSTATIAPSLAVSPPPVPPEAVRRFGAALGGLYGVWQSPRTHELGGSLALLYFAEPWIFGLRISANGLGCCALSSASARGRTFELALFGEASASIVELGRWSFGLVGRAGAGYVRFTGRARFTRDDGTVIETAEQSSAAFDARGELGGVVGFELLSGLDLVASAGATLRLVRFQVRAPPITSDDQLLEPGVATPWAELAVRAHIF